MVAINNNLTEKFKVLTSKNSLEQNDDLFAELFALINTNIENSEEKSLLKNVMIESTKEPIGSLSVEANQIKEKPYDSDNELELAKSLIKIFYKEFGIDDSISQTEKHKNPFKIDKLNVPLDEIKKETTKNTLPDQKTFSEKLDPKLGNQKTLELSENLVLKIEKKKISKKQNCTR